MNYSKNFYAKTKIDSSDFEELSSDMLIELEYYKLKGEKSYGIEIIKKNLQNNIMNIEEKVIYTLCKEETQVNKLLRLLADNKVTPILVDDILEDLRKTNFMYGDWQEQI